MSTAADTTTDAATLVERFGLKAFVESCLVLEEGVATIRDIDLAMMTGFGILPGPFARADDQGLDDVLAALDRAEAEWGEHFAPPLILRRLVAQGRLGKKTGQGFFPYPRPDSGWDEGPVKLETRDGIAIAWLDNPPANSISPDVIRALQKIWEHVDGDEKMAFGGGCELAMACDVRIAAESATFGQPEINLGIIPGFGGTQRLPRLVGPAKALEMNLVGDAISADEAYEFGLANRVVSDHELFDTALQWARKLGGQAPLAVEQVKRVSHKGDLDEGIEAEKEGFAKVFGSEDAREGIGAFLQKRSPKWQGR